MYNINFLLEMYTFNVNFHSVFKVLKRYSKWLKNTTQCYAETLKMICEEHSRNYIFSFKENMLIN